MDVQPIATPATTLEAFIRDAIPMARAMDLHLQAHDGDSLTLSAPLAPNVNDKGCAFGGSLVTLMTLAAWALLELRLREEALACDIFVASSRARYAAPVWEDFTARAQLADDSPWDTFLDTLRERGKARVHVDCVIPGNAHPAATLHSTFVAKRRDT